MTTVDMPCPTPILSSDSQVISSPRYDICGVYRDYFMANLSEWNDIFGLKVLIGEFQFYYNFFTN